VTKKKTPGSDRKRAGARARIVCFRERRKREPGEDGRLVVDGIIGGENRGGKGQIMRDSSRMDEGNTVGGC